MYSIEHRQLVLNELSKIQISSSTSPNDLVEMLTTEPACMTIAFDDEDLPECGPSHAKALFISIDFNDKVVPMSLVDNGSALNICPWRTLERVGIAKSLLTPSNLCVRGFDSSRREIMGNLKTMIKVAGVSFEVDFCVIDMQPSYNLILGRPWLHQARAVASSLHQKLHFKH